MILKVYNISLRNCGLGQPTLEQASLEGLQHVEKEHAGKGENCEKEGEAERNCEGPQPQPPFPTPCTTKEVTGRSRVVMLSLQKRRDWGESVFLCVFLSHYSNLGNNYITLP